MKIISNSALRAFAADHPQAEAPLQGWRRVIEKNRFANWAELKAAFNAVDMLFDHKATLEVYQVHAVTEGTDAQATVSVRLSEDGRIATGQSADTDTVVASVKAYVNALNKLIVRRTKSAPDSDVKSVNYKDAS